MRIIKIGGGARINIQGIIHNLTELSGPFIIVHGANALRDSLAEQLDKRRITLTSLSGYTSVYSDQEALDLIMMSYAGLQNKRIVAMCQQAGINAVGLSGLDGALVRGVRNKGIRVQENGKTLIKRDFSGKPHEVNTSLLNLLIENGYVPVLCIPIIDEHNIPINSENDDIVGLLACELNAEQVIQFIEAPGLLKDKNNPNSLIEELSSEELSVWEEKAEKRMKRKLHALTKLCMLSSHPEIIIADGRVENPLVQALAGSGTLIRGLVCKTQ